VALLALRRLRLDRVWWLVSPGNPLKDHSRLAAAVERMRVAHRIARHPRMAISAIEADLAVRFTVETVRYLVRRCPGVRFVWIMGADSLASFHRWRSWREIANLVPIAVVDRPGWTLKAPASPSAHMLAPFRLSETSASGLADRTAPAWTFLHGPRSSLSSTALRMQARASRPGRIAKSDHKTHSILGSERLDWIDDHHRT
jgi:nicotinate-nucleotide adenylyltransferase